MPTLAHGIGNQCAVVVAIRMAQQAQVAIARLEYLLLRQFFDSPQCGTDGAAADFAAPGLDDVAGEIDASVDGLDDGFARVELQAQPR
ncbi:hypothetical protein D3C87_1500520 [compost metagenome]